MVVHLSDIEEGIRSLLLAAQQLFFENYRVIYRELNLFAFLCSFSTGTHVYRWINHP